MKDNQARKLDSTLGAQYNYPLVLGNNNHTKIRSFHYVESGKLYSYSLLVTVYFQSNIDYIENKFYACGLFGTGSINTHTSEAFIMKLSDVAIVERIHVIETRIGGSVRKFKDIKCSYTSDEQYIAPYLITDNSYVLYGKIRLSDFRIIKLDGNPFEL